MRWACQVASGHREGKVMDHGRIRAAIAAVGVIGGIVVGNQRRGRGRDRTPLPAHVWAPYFETWTADAITDVAQRSGARYFTLAFLETTSKSSCTLAWDGSRTQTVAAGRYLRGHRVAPSDRWRCHPVVRRLERRPGRDRDRRLVQERGFDRRGLPGARHDLQRDAGWTSTSRAVRSPSPTASTDATRRSRSCRRGQPAHGRTVQIQYTLPTSRSGLEASGLAVLQNADRQRRPRGHRQPDDVRLLRPRQDADGRFGDQCP